MKNIQRRAIVTSTDFAFVEQVKKADPHLHQPLMTILSKVNQATESINKRSVYARTFLIKDSTVAVDAGDHIPIFVAGEQVSLVGALRLPITADLKVRFHVASGQYQGAFVDFRFPMETKLSDLVITEADTSTLMGTTVIIYPEIIASDGQVDPAGVASISLGWIRNGN